MLNWTGDRDCLSIKTKIILPFELRVHRAVRDGIELQIGEKIYIVPEDSIAEVYFFEPKLFERGLVSFMDADRKYVPAVSADGETVDAVITFNRRQLKKSDFYTMFQVFVDNGFTVQTRKD